ncbi:MAG: phage tail tape measure protein [Peptoniphilus lacydonensis]|uniref:phage tail tape measure protein n=1 Tax=Peptoniphilus lacydonensis TaxID=1673725 RepID=UPI0029051EF4|nr:phage tail tape measure protein [Peptoniphilus lacydonensis]MDU2116197.1 phage tail tape measure protein [Peptoniphilus lacydonensis]
MASDGKLVFETKIDDSGFKQGLGKLKGIAGKGAKLVTAAIAGVQTTLVAAGGAAVKVGSEFEAGMSQVAATMGMTQKEIQGGSKEFKKLESAAREMGATTQFSATEASEALNYIALAGYGADDAIKLLPKTLNLAAAGGLELGYATDIVTDAMSALGLSIDDADSFIDQMAKTSQKSNTSVGQLGEAILTVGGTAKDLAGGTVELNTALGILANNGIKGAEGGTKLRNVIMSLTAPTDKAAKAMTELGITAFDAEGNMRPLQDVFKDINLEMANMTTQEKKEWLNTVFNKQDLAAVSALLAANATNVDDISIALEAAGGPGEEFKENIAALGKEFDQFSDKQDFVNHVMEQFGLTSEQAGILYEGLKSSLEGGEWNALAEEIKNSAGVAEEMSKVMIDNLKGDFTIMKSALQELGISFYQTFNGDLRDSVQTATGYLDKLSLAMRGINADEMKSSLDAAGVSVDDLKINLVEATLKIDQFDSKSEYVEMAMERWGLSSEQAGILFDTLSNSLENSGNKAQIVGEVLGQTIADLVTKIAEALPEFLQIGINIIQNILDGISQNLGGISDAAVQIGTTLLEGIGQISLQFADIGLTIVENLMNGITQNAGEITSTITGIITDLVGIMADHATEFLTSGYEMMLALAEGLAQGIPDLLAKGLELVVSLGDGIIAGVPNIIKAGAEILKGLAQGLADNLPYIIEQAPRLINEFTNALIEALPTIISTGVQIIVTLAKGLIEAIPTLIANIPQIIMAIVNAFTLYNWFEVGKNVILKIGEGISSVPELIGNAIKTLLENGTNIVTDFAETLYLKGTYLIEKLAEGISGGAAGIAKAAGDIIKNIVKGLLSGMTEIIKAGFEIIKSIATGIAESVPNLLESGLNIIKSLGQFISEGIPTLIETGPQIIAAIISGIASAAGGLISKGAEIIGNFIEGIKGKSGESEAAGTEITTSVNTGLSKGKDEASKSGSDLGSNYAKGIQSSQSTVETGAKTLTTSAKKGLETGKNDISKVGTDTGKTYAEKTKEKKSDSENSGKELGKSAVKGASDASKEMSKSGQTAGDEFVKGIKSKSSDAKNVGSEISKSLASGVTSSKSEVDNAVKKIIQDAINAIQKKKNEFQTKGQELIKELARGFDNAKSQVDNNLKRILQNCISAGNSFKGQFVSVGRNLANGIAQGISSGSGAIQAAARNAVRNAVNAAKRAGQIRSPSRLMKKEVGFYLSAGMAEGIKSGEPLIEDANKKLIHKAEAQLKKLVERGASQDVLKNYLGKNIEDAINYGNLLLNQSNLDFNNYNSNFKLIDKIKDEINMSKNLIEDAFEDVQLKFKIDNILNLPNNQKSNNDYKPIAINIYGANFNDKNEARNYGRELNAQIERERRRYGG